MRLPTRHTAAVEQGSNIHKAVTTQTSEATGSACTTNLPVRDEACRPKDGHDRFLYLALQDCSCVSSRKRAKGKPFADVESDSRPEEPSVPGAPDSGSWRIKALQRHTDAAPVRTPAAAKRSEISKLARRTPELERSRVALDAFLPSLISAEVHELHHAKPSHTTPTQTKPGLEKTSQAKPSQAKHSQAKRNHAKPRQTMSGHREQRLDRNRTEPRSRSLLEGSVSFKHWMDCSFVPKAAVSADACFCIRRALEAQEWSPWKTCG